MLLACVGFFAVLILLSEPALGQNYDKVEIITEKLAEGVYMLTGSGGNIGLGVGDDAVFVIDDQFAPLTPKILTAIAKLSDKPVKFVLNTHWHFDHVGGNENLGKSGSIIVAQENVRKRMSTDQFMAAFDEKVPASPKVALPVVTFTESLSLHLNGEEIRAFHVANAHTDGDIILRFMKSNVVHMGDVFFNGMYPFIDIDSGGSVDGVIAAVDRVLTMIDDKAKVIPGHGPLTDRDGLKAYRAMLATVRDRVREGIKAGKSLEQVLASKPGAGIDETWGKGFLKPEVFHGTVYKSLSAKNSPKKSAREAAKK
jgi:glyoxylase-like metal-dependent hydrolase (beta-lactamase superfamily II)